VNRLTPSRERGTVLIVTMVIVFALGSLVVTLGRHVRSESLVSLNTAAMLEADAIARGAEQYVLALLTQRRDTIEQMDERDFAALSVGNGWFWIVRPDLGDPNLPRYGLVDETSKLDLNRASYERLIALPGMTADLASGIVAWRGGDADASMVFFSPEEAYAPKGAAFETVEELLMLSGMTRELLYGRGGAVAVNGGFSRPSFAERYLEYGLFDYFTVWTRQAAATGTTGQNRVNLNDQNQRQNLRRLLRDRLGDERGGEVIQQAGLGGGGGGGRPGGGGGGGANFIDVFDFARRGGLTVDELTTLEDSITTTTGRLQRGRVNVHTAPREVLRCLEGLSESDADALVAARVGANRPTPDSVAWVWGVLEDAAVGLGSQITGQGQTFSADIVAVSGNGRGFRRVRLVVDASRSTPRIVYRRDMTDHGWTLDPIILASLREGDRSIVAATTSITTGAWR
jgi:DNA uptake protein ComE-like DNA-binding protein